MTVVTVICKGEKEELTVAEDELADACNDHGNAAEEVKGTGNFNERSDAGASPSEDTEDGGLEGDEEAADAEQGWVAETLGEVTLCGGRLVVELLVLLRRYLHCDLAREVLHVASRGMHLHLLVDAVARRHFGG